MSSFSNKNRSPVHENKIPSKFLTRSETSSSHEQQLSTPSFRSVYYGKCAAGSVPFNWESQPGTPKHHSSTPNTTTKLDVPPLTPPPSYFYYPSSESMIKKKATKSSSLLHVILPKLTLIIRRPNLISTSTYRSNYSSSSSSTCSSSEPSSPAVVREIRRAFTAKISTPKTHFSSSKEEGVHALMLCFGPRR